MKCVVVSYEFSQCWHVVKGLAPHLYPLLHTPHQRHSHTLHTTQVKSDTPHCHSMRRRGSYRSVLCVTHGWSLCCAVYDVLVVGGGEGRATAHMQQVQTKQLRTHPRPQHTHQHQQL